MGRGVWGLGDVRKEKLSGEWEKQNYASSPTPDPVSGAVSDYIFTFFSGRNYEKFDMSNDLAQSMSRTLHIGGNNQRFPFGPLTATSNNSAAYYTGAYSHQSYAPDITGSSSIIDSSIFKLDFSNDTLTTFGTTVDYHRCGALGVGNRHYGWYMGGYAISGNADFYYNLDDTPVKSYTAPGETIGAATDHTVTREDLAGFDYVQTDHGIYESGRIPFLSSLSYSRTYNYKNPTEYIDRQSVERIDYSNGTSLSNTKFSFEVYPGDISSESLNKSDYLYRRSEPVNRRTCASACNNDYAWVAKFKYAGLDDNDLYKFDFANDTNSNIGTFSYPVVSQHVGASGNANYAWFTGGEFSDESSSTVYVSGTGDTLVKSRHQQHIFDYIYRLDYSNDTMSSTARNRLPKGQFGHGQSGNQSYGYLSYGNEDLRQKIDYANDTADYDYTTTWIGQTNDRVMALFGDLPNSDHMINDFYNSPTASPYIGETAGSPASSKRYNCYLHNSYATSVSATQWNLPTTHPQVSYPTPPASSPASYFYFAGGSTISTYEQTITDSLGSYHNSILRFSYQHDTEIPSFRGQTSNGYDAQWRMWHASTNNSNYAWLNRGNDSADSSLFNVNDYTAGEPIQRLDFSNDSSVSTRNSNHQRSNFAASGNANYGWWFGGRGITDSLSTYINRRAWPTAPSYSYGDPQYHPTSEVTRTDYSNDTADPSVRASMGYYASRAGATNNGTYAWIYGGRYLNTFSPSVYVLPWTQDHRMVPASTHQNTTEYFGWDDNINRYDFSNDTNDAVNRASLSSRIRKARYQFVGSGILVDGVHHGVRAVGNNSHSYIRFWYDHSGNSDYMTNGYAEHDVQKYDYSNDTTDTTMVSLASSYGYRLGVSEVVNTGWDATGNNDYGYFGGMLQLVKMDYSNDASDFIFNRMGYQVFGSSTIKFVNYPGILPSSGSGTYRDYCGFTAFSGARNQ